MTTYKVTIAAKTIHNVPFQVTRGWNINRAHNWSAYMSFNCETLKDAQDKADRLRLQFRKVNKIGENNIAKYNVSIDDSNNITIMFTEFTGHKTYIRLTSH